MKKVLLNLVLIALMAFTLIGLRAGSVRAVATGDVSVKAVAVYPLTDTIPAPDTPVHTIWFGVGILNPGSAVTVNVTIYLNSVPVIVVNSYQMGSGYQTVVSSLTTSSIGVGTWVASAYVSCPGDQTPGDNTKVGDTLKIGKIADVNCDGIVNMKDLAMVAARYGLGNATKATISPIWIPEVDVNHDGRINVQDLAYYAARDDYYNITRVTMGWGSSGPHGSPAEWSWACDLYRDGVINQQDVAIIQDYWGT